MVYAARHPGHAKKVILQSTAAHLDVERIVAAFSALGGPVAAEAARTFWTAHDNESMMGYLEHCIPLYHSESLTDDGEMEMDLRPGLGAVRVPVLILAGRKDPITPVAAAQEIVKSLPGPDVTLRIFDDSSHFIQVAEPDRFFPIVRDFITG